MGITSYDERFGDRLGKLEAAFDALLVQDKPGSLKFGAGRIPFGSSSGILTDDADLTWISASNQLAINGEVSITAPSNFAYRIARASMTNRHIGINASDDFIFARTGTSEDLRIDNGGIAHFVNYIQPSNVAVSYGANLVVINNLANAALGMSNFGFAFIHAGGTAALFAINGSSNTTIELLDPSGVFSAVAGTASSWNIYWSAGNSRYEIENRRGSALAARIWLLNAA